MNPDDIKQAWKTQGSGARLAVDAELVLQEVRRNQRAFAATIFWRDVREVGVALLMVPLWLGMGRYKRPLAFFERVQRAVGASYCPAIEWNVEIPCDAVIC